MHTREKILTAMRANSTLLCAGLDPDIRKLPAEVVKNPGRIEDKVYNFMAAAVDIAGPHVCAYKAQKAFFDVLPGGHDVLKTLIAYVHETQRVPVIVDCKVGDIDNTMTAYIETIFGSLQADGVVVNPYMGDDVLLPLMEMEDKAIVVLVKTSNPAAAIVQNVKIFDGRPLWQYMLDLVVNRWNKNGNMIPVLSSTVGLNMAEIRQMIPDDMLVLLAGVGAQGGSYEDIRMLLDSEGIGVFVNSSRGILYPVSTDPWQVAMEKAVIETKDSLNRARKVV